MFEPLKYKRRKVILDTDIGPDCDDVGAIAVLLSYAREYGFEVIGINNCTSNKYGCGAIDAICGFCGKGNIPIGGYSISGFYDSDKPEWIKYNKYLSEHFSLSYVSGTLDVTPHVEFYRKLLSQCEDDEVIIISIGMFNCLSDLLDSKKDEYCDLDGLELVKRKVNSLVSMATVYPEGREFNIVCDYNAAKNVLEKFPKNIYVSDFHTGFDVITGFCTEDAEKQKDNPIFQAYALYKGIDNCKNSSFDLTAVQFACEGTGELYSLSQPGKMEFYSVDTEKTPEDATRFIPCDDGKIFVLKREVTSERIASMLNERIHEFDI